jgi:hypothetical protein
MLRGELYEKAVEETIEQIRGFETRHQPSKTTKEDRRGLAAAKTSRTTKKTADQVKELSKNAEILIKR